MFVAFRSVFFAETGTLCTLRVRHRHPHHLDETIRRVGLWVRSLQRMQSQRIGFLELLAEHGLSLLVSLRILRDALKK